MEYIHLDTFRGGKALLDNATIWNRFSSADRHLINSTFLEIRARHANSVEASVDVLGHLRSQWEKEEHNIGRNTLSMAQMESYAQLHDVMESFLRRRLGIQLLCDHHAELHERSNSIVSSNAPVFTIVSNAVTEAQHIVDAHLQEHPDVHVYGQAHGSVIRPWIHHSLVELLKNAMAAVVLKTNQSSSRTEERRRSTLAPIVIFIDQDDIGISIDIIDRGTGIQNEEHAAGLGHSSHSKRWDRLDEQQSYAAVRSPLSSLGVGLKVARYQVELFRGSLSLENNQDGGGGCTASIFLPTDENLPEHIPAHGWFSGCTS